MSIGGRARLYARTINPQFVRLLRTIGFDRRLTHRDSDESRDGVPHLVASTVGADPAQGAARLRPKVAVALHRLRIVNVVRGRAGERCS
jgi:hypothetical protein